MRATVGLILAFWLAVQPASAAGDAEVPWQALAANLKTHRIIADIDQQSFAAATAHYPESESGGGYPIQVGRYLMWKVIGLFASDQRVDQIRLSSFVMSCRAAKGPFATEVICDLNAAILVRNGGSARVIDISTNRNVGRFFDPKRADYASVVYAELRDPLDLAVQQIQGELKSAGVL
jgi:hypothetical protein